MKRLILATMFIFGYGLSFSQNIPCDNTNYCSKFELIDERWQCAKYS